MANTLDSLVGILTDTPGGPAPSQKQIAEDANTQASCAFVKEAVSYHEAHCQALRAVRKLLLILIIAVAGLTAANAVLVVTLKPTIREMVRQAIDDAKPHASAPVPAPVVTILGVSTATDTSVAH